MTFINVNIDTHQTPLERDFELPPHNLLTTCTESEYRYDIQSTTLIWNWMTLLKTWV